MGAQLEDGYTRIANEILEHIAKIDLCGSQRRIIDIIWRYTYGFKRKEHEFSNNFLAKATNMDKKYCREQLKKLIDKRIILVIKEGTYSSSKVLAFNKHFEQWYGYPPLGNEYPPGEGLPPREEIHPTPGEENYPTSGEYIHPTPGVDIPPQERKLKDNLKENMCVDFDEENEGAGKGKVVDITQYPPEFKAFWEEYPRKVDKKAAFKCWNTQIKNKASPDDMILAAKNYAADCKSKKTSEQYIKHAKTFLGPSDSWREWIKKQDPDEQEVSQEVAAPCHRLWQPPE